ncbi:MAG: glycosyltransferase family 4 protein [Bacteroidetes bacterium]|nr:glycosyltransferase family 4 protein [Bacteroidota bacterium]
MHIVHVFFAFNTGGSETMLVDIMNEQIRTNQVSLVIINDLYDPVLIGKLSKRITVTRIGRKPGSLNVIKILFLNLVLLRLRPDIIHCHDHTIIRYIIFAKGIKVLTVHGIRFPVDNFNQYNQLVSISQAVRKDMQTRSGPESEVIYNGIFTEKIVVQEPRLISQEVFRIVQVGRLDHEIKGQHILLKALSRLIQNHQTNIRVDFIGDGPSLDYLRRLAVELEISAFVGFLGLRTRDYIYSHLRDYHLLVQPSLFEGFGLTVAEAMAARVPVLVSGIEGPMEIIGQGAYGYHFISGDSDDCARQIEKIIMDIETDRAKEKVNAAQKFVTQNFSVTETARKYQTLYDSLIQRQ